MDEKLKENESPIIIQCALTIRHCLKTALLHVVLDNNTFCSKAFFIGMGGDTVNKFLSFAVTRAFR
jgi:hypothetical protein